MLPHGPLGPSTVHLAIDMQRLFMPGETWGVAALPSIVDPVRRLTEHQPERTLFTRFVVPEMMAAAKGSWQRYYAAWPDVVGDRLDPARLDILDGVGPVRRVVDKLTFSAFEDTDLEDHLMTLVADTLVVSGIETDVCVLATILAAVDKGYRVVAVSDALASGSAEGHAATLAHVLPRFEQQVELATVADVLQEWKRS